MIQSKKLIPEVYSQSYDMSIFTGLLDLIYTAREVDILRLKNLHLPRTCFEEDLVHLGSLFGFKNVANRDLFELYRHLVKQKGTRQALEVLAEISANMPISAGLAKFRIIRAYTYMSKTKITVKELYTDKTGKVTSCIVENPTETIDNAPEGTFVRIDIYLDFKQVDTDLLETLIQRLASVTTAVILKPKEEYPGEWDMAQEDA